MEFLVYHGPGGRRDWMMVNKKMPVKAAASDEHKENYVSYIVAERGGKVKWQDREEKRKNILFGMGNGTKTAKR